MDADLRCPQVRSLPGPSNYFLGGKKVSFLFSKIAAEGAKTALLDADVGKVDVSVDDVGDGVAHRTPA